MSNSKYVRFPEFRAHLAVMGDVNSAIMGLLAGSQMAVHLLKLTEGSDHRLGEVFPKIPHIKRFNLSTSGAREILDSAESHLGAMAVPYVLGTHEDYMKVCLQLVERHVGVNLGAANVKSAAQHEKLQNQSSVKFRSTTLEQFHLVRKMRNCRIHAGGLVNSPLENHSKRMSKSSKAGWKQLAGYEPRFEVGQVAVHFGHRETVASLAITRNLAQQANEILQSSIPRNSWGEIMLRDLDEVGSGLPKDADQRIRKLRGYARYHYAALKFDDEELRVFDAAYRP